MAGILFIDAEQPFSDQMVGVLRGKGYSVQLLDDGKDGLELARDTRPDLIVLCVELPKMSGYSICNKLKKDNDLKGIPLLITSKEATPETFAQHKKLKTRAEDYLIKPFSEQELLEKVQTHAPAPAAGGAAAQAENFDALDALGGDMGDLGGLHSGNSKQQDEADADFSSLMDDKPVKGALSDDDALLASLDDIGSDLGGVATSASPPPKPRTSIEDDLAEFDALVATSGAQPKAPEPRMDPPRTGVTRNASASVASELPPPPPPPPPLKPLTGTSSLPQPSLSMLPQPSFSTPPTASADLAQVSALRRENTDLKSRVAELEARLEAAEETSRAKDAQLASASAASGGGSAREVLNLKEQLRTKDKEISALKDEVFEKEKSAVEAQESVEQVRGEMQQKLDAQKGKDVEISALNAKVRALSEARDQLEEQVHNRLGQAEQERDQLRGEIDAAKSEAQRARSDAERGRALEDRLKADLDAEKKARKDAEAEARVQEDRALKAFQRLKNEETVREKAKQAVQIAAALLAGEVDTNSDPLDMGLDAE